MVNQSFSASPLPVILQDAFAQGAQRPLRLLKTLQSHVITIQFYPHKFTGHYNQLLNLFKINSISSSALCKIELRFCLFLLTEAIVHARAACGGQLLLRKGSAFRKFSLRALGFRSAPLLGDRLLICVCVVTGRLCML